MSNIRIVYKKSLAVIAVLCLTSCATMIMSYKPIDIQEKIKCPKLKSAVFRASTVGSRTYVEPSSSAVTANPELAQKTLVELQTLNCFSEIRELHLPADELVFNGEKSSVAKTSDEKASEFMHESNKVSSTNIFIEVTSIKKTSRHHSAALPYLIWFTAHLASIGLIPIWMPESLEIHVEISESGKITAHDEIKTSADTWTWSPFIFRSDSIKPNDRHDQSFDRDTLRSALRRAVSMAP